MHFFPGDEDENTASTGDTPEHLAGPESGDYTLPDGVGERIGEGEDHNPASLGDV